MDGTTKRLQEDPEWKKTVQEKKTERLLRTPERRMGGIIQRKKERPESGSGSVQREPLRAPRTKLVGRNTASNFCSSPSRGFSWKRGAPPQVGLQAYGFWRKGSDGVNEECPSREFN